MDFTLSEQYERVREVAARVAREVVAPRAAAVDEEGKFPQDYFEAFRDAGLFGLAFSKEYGGSEAGSLGLAIAIEELGKYDCSAGLMLLTTRLATTCIALAGTPAQKDRYLRGVAEGQLRGCFALTEPETGSDAADITTTAIRDGDGYVLNGIKLWAGQAPVADFAVVVAVTRPGAGAQGVSVFVVDLPHSGFRIVRELPKMGVLGIPVVEIDLHNCRVPASALVGEENKGFRLRNNRLTALPESLGNLTRLTFLDLRANKLVSLPAAIGDLPNLEKLDARWNKLSSLPEWFQRLEQRGCTVYI